MTHPILPGPLRSLRLTAVAALLLACTACLEHLQALGTRVVYDPYSQTFRVERRLVGIEARFLGCSDVPGCVSAIDRTLSMTPDPTRSLALSDRLLQRLMESGAADVSVALEREGDRLDAIVSYTAPVGSPAADDTLVRAEWSSRGFLFGHYYLVVAAQESMTPPRAHKTRKVARSGASGVDWIEEWVLPRWERKVDTRLEIGAGGDLFAEVPGLADELEARGWLDEARSLGGGDASVADADTDTGAGAGADTGADAAPSAVLASTAGDPVGVGLDPQSPAKTWVYEARVSGGGVTPAAAAVALEPVVPALSRCYQRRQKEVPSLEGSVFLSALVKADGTVVATSVNGTLSDPTLLACIDRVLEGWTFAPWGSEGEGVSDVAIPVVFRLENPVGDRSPRERK